MTAFIDDGIALRVAYLITLSWEKWPAFKQGIIDKTGKKIKEPVTEKDRDSWTALHRMVWRLRQALAKLPGGDSLIARLTSTYLMMREDVSYEKDVLAQLDHILEETSVGGMVAASPSVGSNVPDGSGSLGANKKTANPIRRAKLKSLIIEYLTKEQDMDKFSQSIKHIMEAGMSDSNYDDVAAAQKKASNEVHDRIRITKGAGEYMSHLVTAGDAHTSNYTKVVKEFNIKPVPKDVNLTTKVHTEFPTEAELEGRHGVKITK